MLKYVCVGDVMDVVCSVCIVRRLTPVYWDLVACFCSVTFLCAILLRMGCV